MKRFGLTILLGLVVASVSPATAQPQRGKRDHAAIQRRVSKLHAKILREQLGLTGAHAAEVGSLLDRLAAEHRKIQAGLSRGRRALRGLRESNSADTAAYAEALTRIRSNIKKQHQLLERRFALLDDKLTPKQHAILIMELARVQRKMRLRMRQRRRGGGPP